MKKYIFSIAILVALGVSLGVRGVGANTSRISTLPSCTTDGAGATTSPTFLTPGVATSTLTCNLGLLSLGSDSIDSASLFLQFTASSTLSTLNFRYEYSQDGVDWFGDNLTDAIISTTTQKVDYSTYHSNVWGFASSTNACASVGSVSTNTRGCKILNVPTPTKWVRVISTLPIGSLNGSVWGQIVSKTQIINR